MLQVAEVNKVLCAVSYLVDNGYRVTFDQDPKSGRDTSHILHKKSGRIIKLKFLASSLSIAYLNAAFGSCSMSSKPS